MKARREYTKDFKKEAVLLSLEPGRTVGQTAEELGINPNVLTNWRRAYRTEGQQAFRGHGKLRVEEEEIRRLKKENADLKQEKEILKKVLAIFSQPQR